MTGKRKQSRRKARKRTQQTQQVQQAPQVQQDQAQATTTLTKTPPDAGPDGSADAGTDGSADGSADGADPQQRPGDADAAADRDVEAVLTEVLATDAASPDKAPDESPDESPDETPDETPDGSRDGAPQGTRARSAAQAFDLLYTQHARALARQAFLLCGNRQVAVRAVAYAFHTAWERWPEVARDRDPAGWVRAATYEYALSPWHRFHPKQRRPEVTSDTPGDRVLLDALLTLPPSYRSALLLHDGVGLSLADTAAETEASVAAAEGRLTHAREALAERVPDLRDVPPHARSARIAERLRDLAAVQPARLSSARTARQSSESNTRRRTRAAVGLAALVTAATVATTLTVEARNEPPRDRGPADTVAPGAGGGQVRDGGAGGKQGTERGRDSPLPGPMGAGMAAMDESTAYLPQLRSRNDRMELGDFVEVDKKEDNLTGPPGQW